MKTKYSFWESALHIYFVLACWAFLCVLMYGCTKKDADPYKDYEFVKVSQRFTQPYDRATMSVYREEPTDTVIKGVQTVVQSYHRHNLQDMQSSTKAGVYLFKQRDSMAVEVLVEDYPYYELKFNDNTNYERQVLPGDSVYTITVKMAQFFVNHNPLKRHR